MKATPQALGHKPAMRHAPIPQKLLVENRKRLADQMASFVGVITALIPEIGYAPAAALAKEALANCTDIADLVVSRGLLTRERVEELLTPERLTRG